MRGGTREDRLVDHIEVLLPATIARADPRVSASALADCEAAVIAIAGLDASSIGVLDSLALLLLRTESVASSKIERIEASSSDYARALHGVRSNASATSMVAATSALEFLLSTARPHGTIALPHLLRAHELLMADEPSERQHSGALRTVQNWVGGSDFSPRNAMLIPPPPERVGECMDDLLLFCNRDDMPVLVQAALAHAQFETVHPFTDGNGRIGRALINLVLRRRGATNHVVVPIASALVAQRDRYFAQLGEYRKGNIDGLVSLFAEAARLAATQSRVTADRLRELPEMWREQMAHIRGDAAGVRLLAGLAATPIITADSVARTLEIAQSRAYVAIEQLVEARVLRPLTERKRDQVWGAADVLDELDDLAARIARAANGSGR